MDCHSSRKRKSLSVLYRTCRVCGKRMTQRTLYDHIKTTHSEYNNTEAFSMLSSGDEEAEMIMEDFSESQECISELKENGNQALREDYKEENYEDILNNAEVLSNFASVTEETESEYMDIEVDDPDDLDSEVNSCIESTCNPPLLEIPINTDEPKLTKHAKWSILFILSWGAYHNISEQAQLQCINMLCIFIGLLGHSTALFPTSWYSVRKCIGIRDDVFIKYVMCPNDKCRNIVELNQANQLCTNDKCRTQLFNTVKSCKEKIFYKPKLAFSYFPLISALSHLLKRQGIEDALQHWRKRKAIPGLLADVYDGKVFQDYKHILDDPNSISLQLNIDWFRPYRKSARSVGALYIALMDLPRRLRFRKENMVLLSVFPHAIHKTEHLNQLLRPFVEELKQLCSGNGVWVPSTAKYRYGRYIKAYLLAISADLPATKAIAGFKSCTALHGCHKCKKYFPRTDSLHGNFSGFDRDNWPKRTGSTHRQECAAILEQQRQGTKADLEKKYGCRWSILLELDYFDPVRFITVDGMHNLHLGSASWFITQLQKKELLTNSKLQQIQNVLDMMDCPSDIGRLPHKFSSKMQGIKAEELMNWTLTYSTLAFSIIELPDKYRQCWAHFVTACRLLHQRAITAEQLDEADRELMLYCLESEKLFGELSITPNMHLHAHLKEVIQDWGPLIGFWCYPFERLNGILVDIPNSNKIIEFELMRKHCTSIQIQNQIHLLSRQAEQNLQPEICAERDTSTNILNSTDSSLYTLLFSFWQPVPTEMASMARGVVSNVSPYVLSVSKTIQTLARRMQKEEEKGENYEKYEVKDIISGFELSMEEESINYSATLDYFENPDAGVTGSEPFPSRPLPVIRLMLLKPNPHLLLQQYYQAVYGSAIGNVACTALFFNRLAIGDEIIGSAHGRNHKSSLITARFYSSDLPNARIGFYYGRVMFFIRHYVSITSEEETTNSLVSLTKPHTLAYVRWYKRFSGKPPDALAVMSSRSIDKVYDSFDHDTIYNWLPVQRIAARCLTYRPSNNSTWFYVIPIPRKLSM